MSLPPENVTVPATRAATPARGAVLDILTPTFTGSGKEYFRIWVVNLLLTVATCGVYSAWAKARRVRYFDRNTMLAGATFDFGGRPGVILKGRVLAVLLLVAYHYALRVSLALGLAVAGSLLLALPFLMRGALRYRLCNTSYRGLAFGFRGSVAGAYAAYLPPLAAVLLPGVLLAIDPDSPLAALPLMLYLGWPAMHAAMKRYQHAHITYGNRGAQYEVPLRHFVRPYVLAALLIVLGLLVAVAALGMLPGAGWGRAAVVRATPLGALAYAVPAYVVLLLTGPYLQVRLANLVWSGTAFPGMFVHCDMRVRALVRLRVANAVLTVLTLGLYRPFAVVRVYRYRLACLSLQVVDDFEAISAGSRRVRRGAAGDGAAGFLGLDISW
jgi:uncharacterized membrane protein YjgN (DUF898 family)